MTSKFFFTCIMATMFALSTATATTTFFDNIPFEVLAVNRTLQVKVATNADETVEISIETASGTIVHNEKVSNTAAWKRYDLHQLEVGDYKLVVENGRTKTIQPFTLDFGGIKITESERVTKGLPQIKQIGNGMTVRAYMSKKGEFNVKIVDNQGINAFEETTKGTALAKHYNLGKLPSGIYFVEVTADGETQYATIVLR
jgi:hypothetical protein